MYEGKEILLLKASLIVVASLMPDCHACLRGAVMMEVIQLMEQSGKERAALSAWRRLSPVKDIADVCSLL